MIDRKIGDKPINFEVTIGTTLSGSSSTASKSHPFRLIIPPVQGQKPVLFVPGYYGNEIDGLVMPRKKGKKEGDEDEEETELIQNSSEDEMDEDGDVTSVATTPPMKPVITDRLEQQTPKNLTFNDILLHFKSNVGIHCNPSTETTSTCPISRGSHASISRAGGRTREGGFTMPT